MTARWTADRSRDLLADGRVDEALAVLEPALAVEPADPALLCALGECHLVADRPAHAAAVFERAVQCGATAAWHGLGCARLALQEYGTALEALARAAADDPALEIRYRLGDALFHLGRVDAACAHFRAAAGSSTPATSAMARRALANIVPSSGAAGHAEVLAARRAWLADLPLPDMPPPRPRPGEKLRIAYLSSVFGSRNYMMPVLGMIARHDRSRFEVHLLCDGPEPTEACGYRAHAEDRIWQVAGASNDRLCAAIAEAGIDVLVDMNGYTRPDRLAVSIARPARVVVGWVNMFATTGSAAFDALVGDGAVIRPEEEAFYPEPIHRVPGSYLAFEVNFRTPAVVAPPSVATGAITFGSLASQYKLDDAVMGAWAAILRAAPTARLVLRNAALSDASNQAHLRSRFTGIDADRITLLGRAPHEVFLATYDGIDVALDTFPYSGGTTTTEALWQGVPVLTLDGDRWAARTSASLLRAAGWTIGWRPTPVPMWTGRSDWRRTRRPLPGCNPCGMACATGCARRRPATWRGFAGRWRRFTSSLLRRTSGAGRLVSPARPAP